MNFGARLRSLRKSKILTLQQITQALGVGVTIVGHWERRAALVPPPESVFQLAELVGIDPTLELPKLSHKDGGKFQFLGKD